MVKGKRKQFSRMQLQICVGLILIYHVFLVGPASGQLTSNLHHVILIENGQIYFDSGYSQGIREGMHFQIYRIDPEGQPIKIGRLIVSQTFDRVSKGTLIAEDLGVEVKIGDRVEILSMPKRVDSVDNAIVGDPEGVYPSHLWDWLTLSGGIVASGLAFHFRNETYDAYDQYRTSVDPRAIQGFREDTERHLLNYRIFAGVSIGLLGHSVYKRFLEPRARKREIAPSNHRFSSDFSPRHVSVTFKYAF